MALAQVRILVDGDKYIKGMAFYSDDLLNGVDVAFNTNKFDQKDALKKIKTDNPNNPFGALIKENGGQYHYIDENGERKLGLINMYKAKVINFPFFYISESIAQDKTAYYRMLSDSCVNSYDEWIRYFIRKCTMQAKSLIGYIDGLNSLYQRTKDVVQESVNSPRFDKIIECIFTQPIITVAYLAEKLSVTHGQAKRYLDKLEEMHVLLDDDRKRGRKYYFADLLDLSRRS